MGGIGALAATPAILARLVEFLADEGRWVRQEAAQVVRSAPRPPAILARLAALLADGDGDVRKAAAEAVSALGAGGRHAGLSGPLGHPAGGQGVGRAEAAVQVVGALHSGGVRIFRRRQLVRYVVYADN